ncbi:MAG: 50S ribosomal protein L21 [Nitrospiria bacterium]
MYAVLESGGKQYRVKPGDIVHLEKCDVNVGDEMTFSSILFFQDEEGGTIAPEVLKEVSVKAKVLRQARAKKIIVFKKKRRKNYRRTQGHRQSFTRIQISEIVKEISNGT